MQLKQFYRGVIFSLGLTPFNAFAHEVDIIADKSIEQHVAQLYFEKPYLQHYYSQREHERIPTPSFKKRLKKMYAFLADYGLNMGMFAYCSYKIYDKHQEIYDTHFKDTKNTGLKATILSYIPHNIINAPKHTSFFLDSVEIIIKAFLLKTVIRLLMFLGK